MPVSSSGDDKNSRARELCSTLGVGVGGFGIVYSYYDYDLLVFVPICRVYKKKLNRFEIVLNFAKQPLVSSF